jgi:hypothetical protein
MSLQVRTYVEEAPPAKTPFVISFGRYLFTSKDVECIDVITPVYQNCPVRWGTEKENQWKFFVYTDRNNEFVIHNKAYLETYSVEDPTPRYIPPVLHFKVKVYMKDGTDLHLPIQAMAVEISYGRVLLRQVPLEIE